jgi:hypothetical protein
MMGYLWSDYKYDIFELAEEIGLQRYNELFHELSASKKDELICEATNTYWERRNSIGDV